MLILAHRGAHEPDTPAVRENTLDAFRAARDLGVDGVELDVRLAGGELYVHHDPLPVPRPAWIPTLREVLDVRPGLVDVEIKASPLEPGFDPSLAVADAVARHPLGDSDFVTSFNLAALGPVVGVRPTGWLTTGGYDQAHALETVAAFGHAILAPPDVAVTPALIEAAHARGVRVLVWTVNDADRMEQLGVMGADVLVTDRPGLALRVLRPA